MARTRARKSRRVTRRRRRATRQFKTKRLTGGLTLLGQYFADQRNRSEAVQQSIQRANDERYRREGFEF